MADRAVRRAVASLALASVLSLVPFGVARDVAAAEGPKDWKAAAAKVDDLVAARWKVEKDLLAAPRADDSEFLRRVTMDLTGTIPAYEDTVQFLADAAPDKRAALVDRLLASKRHADWFATWYSNLLVGSAIRNRNLDRRTFNDWLRDQFRKNRPYDELAYDLINASGNSETNGAVGYMSDFEQSAANAAGKISRHFMGVQIQCAQCHDHPYDKRIKQQDFADFAAFFFTTSVRRNMTPGNPDVSFDVHTLAMEKGAGGRSDQMMPMRARAPLMTLEGLKPKDLRGRGMAMSYPDPKFLLGKVVKDVPGIDRRELLARWITSKSNEWFAPAFANRMWSFLVGRGIVHPVDDFSNSNKPANPELLKLLADELARADFDIHHLIRVIVNSETYQRTSKMPRGIERPDPSLFAVAAVKPLSVEQSFDALFRATGKDKEIERRIEMGERAPAEGRRQLMDPRMQIYALFRRAFDDDEGTDDETFTGTIPRGLLMMNGPQINDMMSVQRNPDSPLARILKEERSDRERVRQLYLTTLSRDPSPEELRGAIQSVHTSREEREGYEDLLWALCNTTEFMSNH